MDSEHAWPSLGAALPEAGDEQAGERLMNEATVAVMERHQAPPALSQATYLQDRLDQHHTPFLGMVSSQSRSNTLESPSYVSRWPVRVKASRVAESRL